MLDRLISWIPKPAKSIGSAPPEYQQAARVATSRFFDEAYYLKQAEEANETVGVYPQLHYVRSGYRRYNPHPDWDAVAYAKAQELSPETNPLLHYLDTHTIQEHSTDRPALFLAPEAKTFCFEHGRYLYALAIAFHEAGCRVFLKSPSDATRQRDRFPFFSILTREPWVTLLSEGQVPPGDYICLTDLPDLARQGSSLFWQRRLPTQSDAIICPFPMHARQYQQGYHRHLRWLRTRNRTTTLYFSGANGWAYRIPYFRIRYRMTGRARLLQVLHTNFSDKIDPGIVKDYRLRQRTRQEPPIVLADQRTQRSPSVLWLEQLAHTDFFLCLPGAYVPIAHNIVEAMAVGTIPILAYPHYLHPALEDGVNCLVYDGEKSFQQVLHKALSLADDEKARLRAGAINYYEQYLDPATWAKRLLGNPLKRIELSFPYESLLKPDSLNTIRH